jgi:hypothetical protein
MPSIPLPTCAHWANLPPNCRITDREPRAPLDYYRSPGIRIKIDDGYGFTINLYYDLRTKQMLACRACPSSGTVTTN